MAPLSDASPTSGVHVAAEAAEFAWDGHKLEAGIGLALSGGGFRSMLFQAGALLRLNELGVLSRVSRISSVSGGSIAAGYLAKVWNELGSPEAHVFQNFRMRYVEPIVAFSRQKIDVVNALTGLLPWTTAAEEVAKSYEELLGPATLQDLPEIPRFVFCATNLQTGVLWRFSKPYAGDYLVGRIDKPAFKLAQAVAASSAFPPILSPLALQPPPASFANWSSGGATVPLPSLAQFREKVMLTDGGVYDNHGLEPVLKRYMTIFVSDGGAPFERVGTPGIDWISQLRRVLDVTDNQVRALRRRDLIDRLRLGNDAFRQGARNAIQPTTYERTGAYWGIDTDPGRVDPPGALSCGLALADRLARLPTRLSDLGERETKQLVNWGYAICDRSIRANYSGPLAPLQSQPDWPFRDVSMS
jgi:NTE family protein